MNHSRTYFGGSKVREKGIRRLQATSFPELVSSCFNVPVPFPMTRKDFLAHPDRDTLKDIDYVCPCTFKDPEGRRAKENAGALVLAIFDIDDTQVAKDFFESPKIVGQMLWPLNFVLYTTAKHTPEKPRLRIIVDVEPWEGDGTQESLVGMHYRVVSHLMERLGIPRGFAGQKESRVIVQPAYRPMQFKGEQFIAVLDSYTEGEALRPDDTPEETVWDQQQRSYAYDGFAADDGDITSGLLSLPIHGLEPEDIREALFAIDPDCDRARWIEIMAGLRHNFRTEDEASDAYLLFDEWSSGGSKYRGEEDTFYQWKSIRPDAMGRNPITLRSLFYHAMTAGWSNQPVAIKLSRSIEQWIAEMTDGEVLFEEGCRRIAGMPFRNDVVEEGMVMSLRKRIKALTGKLIDKKTFLREVSRLRQMKRAEEDEGVLPGWARPWTYIGPRNVFYNIISGVEMSPEGFNRFYGEQLMPANTNDPQALAGRPAIAPADFLLNVKRVRRVEGIIYDPRHDGAEPFFDYDGKSYVNEYRRSTVPALDEVNSDKVKRYMVSHLVKLVGKKYAMVIFDWLAYQVQFPGDKVKWCILIQSEEGAGKTVIVDWLEAAIGKPNVKRVETVSLDGVFNDYLGGCQVVAFEEIWMAGKGRAELVNRLKPFHTNLRVTFRRKFQPEVTMDNVTNGIAFTNKHHALHLEKGNRRWFCVKSLLQSKAEIAAMEESGYFVPMFMIAEQYGGAIRHCLLNHKISEDFNPKGHAPQTDYALEMIEASKNPLLKAIEEKLTDGDPRFGRDLIDLVALEDDLGHLMRNNHPVSHYLTELGYRSHEGNTRFQVNGHRTQIWVHRDEWEPDFGDPVEMLRFRIEKVKEGEL